MESMTPKFDLSSTKTRLTTNGKQQQKTGIVDDVPNVQVLPGCVCFPAE